MSRKRKTLLTLCVVAAVAAIAVLATFSAFSTTTSNPSNSFTAGNVSIGDNDAGGAMFPAATFANQGPGSSASKCIKVTYTGSLDSTVKLYTPSTAGAGAEYINLTITAGTQPTSTFPNCDSSTFTPVAGAPVFSGTVASFDTAHSNFGNGFSVFPGNGTKWVQNDALVYKFDMSVQDTNDAQDATTGNIEFRWEAQNQ
jgi:hypothetical protein